MEQLETLCLACGLCCDGSLFDNVRLEPEESVETLKEHGLPVKHSRAKQPVAFFRQPCAAFCEDKTCRVYANRPKQCRRFECQVFKDVEAGAQTLESGLKVVKQARGKAEKVRRLLTRAGEVDEGLSIGKRFQRVQRWIERGEADEAVAEVFGELGLAMHQLDLLAHRRFYTVED